MLGIEAKSEEYHKIRQMYLEYLRLYKFFNNGSLKGCTNFATFYWTHSYYHKSANLLKELGINR